MPHIKSGCTGAICSFMPSRNARMANRGVHVQSLAHPPRFLHCFRRQPKTPYKRSLASPLPTHSGPSKITEADIGVACSSKRARKPRPTELRTISTVEDHFQVGDLRQLGQNVVLYTIGKRRVLFLFAQIFKWQNSDSGRYRLPAKFVFPNHHAQWHCHGEQHCCHDGDSWIPAHPFSPATDEPSTMSPNRLML